jgi:hypothetical protein
VREEGPGGDLSAGARIAFCVIGHAKEEDSARRHAVSAAKHCLPCCVCVCAVVIALHTNPSCTAAADLTGSVVLWGLSGSRD